jgi:hypothetical protein
MIILILHDNWKSIAKERIKVGRKKKTRISKVMIQNLCKLADETIRLHIGTMYKFR